MAKFFSLSSRLLRPLLNPAAAIGISVIFLVATLGLTLSAQNAIDQGAWFTALLGVNIVGIVVLSVFLLASFARLLRQYKKRIMGSRLMVRFASLFIILTILPIGVVYYFSSQFLSKGVDSWFDVKIEQALKEASLLGRGFLEARKQIVIDNARIDSNRIAQQDAQSENAADIIRLVDKIRQERGYAELDLFTRSGQVIASSNPTAINLYPNSPDKIDLSLASKGEAVVKLEPMGSGALQYRVLHPVVDLSFKQQFRVLQIIEPLPLRYSRLGNSLEQATSEYNRLSYLRKPLKLSFLLTLSLITLMTTLISIWLALYAARRLVAPINELAMGTRAVAAGDYSTQLTAKSEDELGMLVLSFNSMITQVRGAQDLAQENHVREQEQRTYLQSVLSNLSSGVLSFDHQRCLQTHNNSAANILNIDLKTFEGLNIEKICLRHTELVPFCALLKQKMQKTTQKQTSKDQPNQQELRIESDQGTKILTLRVSTLEDKDNGHQGWVVVFDDVSDLVHAQKDAAWGEVARRLAHEIKNPLTPIGLSAERIRNKYLKILPEDQREALDRSTRTISEQVQTLKRMVDAFSSYARSERLNLRKTNVNQLIEDVVELHREPDNRIRFELALDTSIEALNLDQDGIRQILNNIIGNAQDSLHSIKDPFEPMIHIQTQHETLHEKAGISIVIRDNGKGFDTKIIDQVFQPYVTQKSEGTGLGMAIVKRIVNAHGGFVNVSNLESGAQVKIWLLSSIEQASG